MQKFILKILFLIFLFLLSCNNTVETDSPFKLNDGIWYASDAEIVAYANDTIIAITDWTIDSLLTTSILILENDGNKAINYSAHFDHDSLMIDGSNIYSYNRIRYNKANDRDSLTSVDFYINNDYYFRFFVNMNEYDHTGKLVFSVYVGTSTYQPDLGSIEFKFGYHVTFSELNSSFNDSTFWGDSLMNDYILTDAPHYPATYKTTYQTNDSLLINELKRISWEKVFITAHDIYNAKDMFENRSLKVEKSRLFN